MEYENLDAVLVKMVQQFDNIYDKSHGAFKNRKTRENTWRLIAEHLKRPLDECQQRWNVIRTRYALERRKCKTDGKPSTWPIYDSMQFLDKFMLPRKSYRSYKSLSTNGDDIPIPTIWDVKTERTDSMDQSYFESEARSEGVDEDNDNEERTYDSSVNNFGKVLLGHQERYTESAEEAFGKTVSIMLKNIRGHRKRRKAQADIMQVLSNYDSDSDTE